MESGFWPNNAPSDPLLPEDFLTSLGAAERER